MSQTTWQFYGGINTIGGTIISIEHEEYRLVFDLGRLFNPSVPVFDSEIKARDIRDLQRLNNAPKVPGLFEDGSTATFETMVLISHSHLDHTGLLPYLRTDIPVLMTTDTHRLLTALDDVLDGPQRALLYRPIAPGKQISFGPFEITSIAVDHDTPGACAFFIQAQDIRFVYSGDLRLHGANPEVTLQFAQAAKTFQPDVLFIEGTRAGFEDNSGLIAERDLPNALVRAISNTRQGAYFTFYPRHPERLNAFLHAARRTGRTCVLEASSAYIFDRFGGDIGQIAIYGGDTTAWTDIAHQWVKERRLRIVTPEDIRGREEKFIVELTYRRLRDFIDIDAQPGGLFIHSNGTPLGPYDPAWPNMMYWVENFGLDFQSIGSTGHGSRGDILQLVKTIAPRVLMPIHSFTPERIGLPTVRRIMPAYGRQYTRASLDGATYPSFEDLQSDH